MDVRLGKIEFKLTRLRLWGGLFLGLYLAHVLMPIYWRRAGADACTFGPITNAEYRAYRQAAEWELLFAQFWLPGDRFERAKRISQAIEVVSGGSQSLYHRLAAMHAVMRSLNGQHQQTNFYGDREPITHDARKIWDLGDPNSKPRYETYIGRKNKAKTGEDPGLRHLYNKKRKGYNPISYVYSYSTWIDILNPLGMIRYFDTLYRMRFQPQFLTESIDVYWASLFKRYSLEADRRSIPGDARNNSFGISSIGPSYPSLNDGSFPRNNWKSSAPYGPCPSIPSQQWANGFIKQNGIINLRY